MFASVFGKDYTNLVTCNILIYNGKNSIGLMLVHKITGLAPVESSLNFIMKNVFIAAFGMLIQAFSIGMKRPHHYTFRKDH